MIRIASVKFPALNHVHNILEWLVGMRGRAYEAFRIGSVADYDLIYDVFQTIASGSHHGNERHFVSQALFDEFVEKSLVGDGGVEDDFASERHCLNYPWQWGASP